MAAYGGQDLALDVQPFSLASPLLNAQTIIQARQANQLAAGRDPELIAQARQNTVQSELATAAAKRKDALQDIDSQNAMIAEAASKIDPTDPDAAAKWDTAMQGAVAKGAQGAQQWIGRYSPAAQTRVTSAYAAPNPQASAAALSAGGLPATPPTPANYDVMFKDMTPAQMQATYQKTEAVKQALIKVSQSPNPGATWDQEAQQLGHPEWVGQYSPLQIQRLWGQFAPAADYLQQRVNQASAGLPAPLTPPVQKDVGGALYSIDPKTGAATLAAGGKWSLAGTDPKTGDGVYINAETGEEKRGDMPLGAKPGTQRKQTVFELKQQAWIETHPGDTTGALEYANGRKTMQPATARAAADGQAARDLQAATLAGETIANPSQWLKDRADEHYGELTGATGATPAPAETIPQRAVALLKEGVPHTFNNGTTWTLKNGKPVRLK